MRAALESEDAARADTRDTGAESGTEARIRAAVAALGDGALGDAAVTAHIRPLFSRVLAAHAGRVYLANHSLGRPLDAMAEDVAEATDRWYDRMGEAWDTWLAEMQAHRARLARLLGAERTDCIVPRTSAGQALRAVLNTYDEPVTVVATRGEFDSIDLILRHYAQRRRIALDFVEPDADGRFHGEAVAAAIDRGCDLLVLSQVIFNTGQVLPHLARTIQHAHDAGARVLVDTYHSLGVFPVDLAALDTDFAIGGSYKYLRGGPGACFLYLHPRWLDGSLSTLDTGWFAKRSPFSYERPDPPQFAPGGDAFLESTPAVLPFYQARSGQVLALALDPGRLRAHSIAQQTRLCAALARRGIAAAGASTDHGAFVTVRHPQAVAVARRLGERGIVTDARGPWLRLCPDILTTGDELERAAGELSTLVA